MIPGLTEPLVLPSGYGFRGISAAELRERRSLLDLCLIFEPPRRRGSRQYVLGVDVGDGLGQDRSCIQVLRLGSIDEPAEQVAEYLSSTVQPMALAYTIQALGEYYRDHDGIEAKVAVEYTHHGLSTIDTLHLHLGYPNQYRWEYFDAADASRRYATMFGWHTTPRTRPIMVDKLRSALLTLDPVTGLPDLLTHSPRLHEELQDFQTSGALWEAAAAKGAHDDTVMALAIAYVVGWRMQGGELEPLEDRRRRRSEQKAVLAAAAATPAPLDYRNSPATSQMQSTYGANALPEDESFEALVYDFRESVDDLPY